MCVSGILQLPSALVLGLLFGRVFSHTILQHKEKHLLDHRCEESNVNVIVGKAILYAK